MTDSSTISTVLTCPERPQPQPEPSRPVAPPGPDVPPAGVAGAVATSRLPSCLRRGSVVILRALRVASVRLFVGNEPIHGVSVRPLQRRVVIRVRQDFAPGRYRVTARVRYQRGAGTAPVVSPARFALRPAAPVGLRVSRVGEGELPRRTAAAALRRWLARPIAPTIRYGTVSVSE